MVRCLIIRRQDLIENLGAKIYIAMLDDWEAALPDTDAILAHYGQRVVWEAYRKEVVCDVRSPAECGTIRRRVMKNTPSSILWTLPRSAVPYDPIQIVKHEIVVGTGEAELLCQPSNRFGNVIDEEAKERGEVDD